MTWQVIAQYEGAADKAVIMAKENTMTAATEAPIDVVSDFFQYMQRGDYDSAMALFSDDCEYTNPPPIGSVRGPSAVRAVLEPFFAPTLENELKLLREASMGQVVFLERLDRHRLTEKWVELPVTGVLEVHDGRITYWRDYFDAATILSQWPTA
jgi:limonene-1,2-epoxide hydrolase